MSTEYIIAHDVGTSSTKAVLFNTEGRVLCSAMEPYSLYNPHPNWAEQDPEDYWKAIVKTTREVMEKSEIPPEEVLGIAFTTQAMGIIPVDKEGKVLRPNITWVDGRAEKQARKIMKKFLGEEVFKSFVGIKLTGKDVIPKLLWLKEEEPQIYDKTEYFLDVNGFLKFRSTGKKVAEWSGASSYGFDLKKKDWLRIFFKAAGIDTAKLPPLVRSIDVVGGLTKEAAEAMGLKEGTPVVGGCDDTQSATVGSSAVEEGEAHIYLGTSAWVGVSTKRDLKFKHGAACLQSADPQMNLLVGVTESAGSVLKWIIEEFYSKELHDPNIPDIYAFLNEEARKVPAGSDFLILTPWIYGERCPVSTTTTRSTMFNIGPEHKRGHLVKAAYEGVAYNLRWILENYKRDFGFDPPVLKVIGGGALNPEWMQIISDVTQKRIEVPEDPEIAGAIGAAMCVAVGLGVCRSFSEVKGMVKIRSSYSPLTETFATYDRLFASYQSLYYSLERLYRETNSPRFSKEGGN